MTTTKKPSAPITVTAWLKSQPDPTFPTPEDEAAADRSAWDAGRTPHPLSTLTERRFAEHLASIAENRHPGTRAATLAEVERIVLDAWDLVEALDGVRALMTARQSEPPAQAPRDMTADEAREVTERMPRPGR